MRPLAAMSGVIFLVGLMSSSASASSNVAAWGSNRYGETNIPAESFASVVAGSWHNIGLRSDGTLYSWGLNDHYQTNVPGGQFSAVAAGDFHSIGLRTYGTLDSWGDVTNPPGGQFTTIEGYAHHGVAIKTDGTLAAWGDAYSQPLPSGTFKAIASGFNFGIGLRTDGTLAAWGDNVYGQLNVPTGTFASIDAFYLGGLARRTDGTLAAWGRDLFGEVSNLPSGTFTSITAGDAHGVAIRPDGTLVAWGRSASGELNVPSGTFARVSAQGEHTVALRVSLTEVGGGTSPTRPDLPTPDSKPATKNKLVLITHGWNREGAANIGWIDQYASSLQNAVGPEWKVYPWHWEENATQPGDVPIAPLNALRLAKFEGNIIGKALVEQGWEQVHLIGHSAGAGLIQAIADSAKQEATKRGLSTPKFHLTFLDPFTGADPYVGKSHYGENAEWADHYYSNEGIDNGEWWTGGKLTHAFNVDVTKLFDGTNSAPHKWPYLAYGKEIVGYSEGTALPDGFGFDRSLEIGGQAAWDASKDPNGDYKVGNDPKELSPLLAAASSEPEIVFSNPLEFSSLIRGVSSTGTVSPSGTTLTMTTGSPAWIAAAVDAEDWVDFFTFTADFTSLDAEGFLSVYWNDQLLGTIDERYVLDGPQSYDFALDQRVAPGVYVLGLRLDPFSSTSSTITISDLQLAAIPEPATWSAFGFAAAAFLRRRRAA